MKKLISALFIFATIANAATEKEIVESNRVFREGYQFMMVAEGTGFSMDGPSKEQIEAYGKAKERFEEAIRLHPENVQALVMLANVHWAYDEIDKTIELYSRAIAAQPTADEVISARGGAYVYKRDFESAKKDQKRLEELGSEFAATLKNEIEREEKN
ncbi:tetratricopeptide repeat protein [Pelagicoccus sp. SDUM812003]|uniref:tetratricopeptide repeat protein n=1 Tax=Pelagicoccus sp. SDUM812003 TaxID=3041267 RepID=UPI00280E3474|nr:tetratricopeptide repeat protein [Pelagicoccus sp. SDUM812003]MDQ8205709.1 hypothetical protein [Pelagicoccus sp. SDUM812003]